MSSRSPREIVDRHESDLSADHRRRQGAHYTPEGLARRIVELGWDALGRVPARVCDPSCGAGAVLLAAADRLLDAGVDAREVVQRRLVGFEIDPSAAAAARAALVEWARIHGAGDARAAVVELDSLCGAVPDLPGPKVDLVCGNPPFLTQLRRRTVLDPASRLRLSQRWPQLGAYTDAAGLHLLAALDLVGPDGVVALLQPRSVLGSRDAAPVREAAVERGRLVTLWVAGEGQFRDASVGVCLPVIRLGSPRGPDLARSWSAGSRTVELSSGEGAPQHVPAPPQGSAWSALLAHLDGTPSVTPGVPTVALGELVEATAGFRDEFYALAPAAVEGPEGGHPLVSVGMIDPCELRWGERPRRLGGRRMSAPVVPAEQLGPDAAGAAAWARRRLVPKVLVATQTRVLEAVLDREGRLIPLTPVISVESRQGGPEARPWAPAAVAAAISAPCTTAMLTYRVAGTGLSADVLRPSAKEIESLRVPAEERAQRDLERAWDALEAQRSKGGLDRGAWREFAHRSNEAFGVDDDDLVEWWWQRHPTARAARRAATRSGAEVRT